MIPIPRIELSAANLKLVFGIACAVALALLVNDRNRWKAAAAERQYRLEAERTAHAGTMVQYRAAADRARAADRANADRVKSAQAAINERSVDDYQKRLAAARSAANRLRVPAAAPAGNSGAGRAATLPGLSAAAGGAAETAGQDRLSVDEERARRDRGALGPEDALIATEQAIQLDELIKWVRRQAEIDVNRSSGPAQPREPRDK